jgi:hypothetical protein
VHWQGKISHKFFLVTQFLFFFQFDSLKCIFFIGHNNVFSLPRYEDYVMTMLRKTFDAWLMIDFAK